MIQTYRKRADEIGKELSLIYNSIIKFNENLPKYNEIISTTWFDATRKAMLKCEEENITDKDDIKKVWIDTLEDEFAELYNSDEFGILTSKLLNSENEINKHLTKLAEIYSKALNMPTRSEVDDIYMEITKLKREVKKISDKLKMLEKSELKNKPNIKEV
ncbi:MAG: poly(R)-hydroxyalkanoic acid synthase subunit PhaE [Candidatus Nitrosocaldaceae archaeon]